MLKPITNKGLFWELQNSIWIIWTIFPFGFFNYISFFYIGARLKDKKLFLYGVLYAIPFSLMMIFDSNTGFFSDTITLALVLGWIISIIHAFFIVRPRYLLSRANGVAYQPHHSTENRPPQSSKEKMPSPVQTNAYENNIQKTPSSLIDVNVASETELASIHEIGPLLAAKIVHERIQVGLFTSYDHFAQVMDFKPHIAHKLKHSVTVGNDTEQQSNTPQQGRMIDF